MSKMMVTSASIKDRIKKRLRSDFETRSVLGKGFEWTVGILGLLLGVISFMQGGSIKS